MQGEVPAHRIVQAREPVEAGHERHEDERARARRAHAIDQHADVAPEYATRPQAERVVRADREEYEVEHAVRRLREIVDDEVAGGRVIAADRLPLGSATVVAEDGAREIAGERVGLGVRPNPGGRRVTEYEKPDRAQTGHRAGPRERSIPKPKESFCAADDPVRRAWEQVGLPQRD